MKDDTMSELFGDYWPQAQGLKPCTLKDFVKNVIIYKFGMGHDGAINGLKSYFSVQDATDAAISCGYDCTVKQAQNFLNDLVERKYFEQYGTLYRRRIFVTDMKL